MNKLLANLIFCCIFQHLTAKFITNCRNEACTNPDQFIVECQLLPGTICTGNNKIELYEISGNEPIKTAPCCLHSSWIYDNNPTIEFICIYKNARMFLAVNQCFERNPGTSGFTGFNDTRGGFVGKADFVPAAFPIESTVMCVCFVVAFLMANGIIWSLVMKKAAEIAAFHRLFGADLEEWCLGHETSLPSLVPATIFELNSRGVEVDGIHRITGNLTHVKQLRDEYDATGQLDLSPSTVPNIHDVVSLFKLFLRLMPRPLITDEVVNILIEILSGVGAVEEKLENVRRALKGLPTPHFRTLGLLIQHLAAVASQQQINRMPTENLCIVYIPTIMRTSLNGDGEKNVFCFLMEHNESIFGMNSDPDEQEIAFERE